MWTWTKIAGRALTNLGMIVLGIAAAKELLDTGVDLAAAFRDGHPPIDPSDGHPFPPMAS
ncbi:MAG: hypothetical protein ABIR79_07785 [Candidatus Binatia bacterium]